MNHNRTHHDDNNDDDDERIIEGMLEPYFFEEDDTEDDFEVWSTSFWNDETAPIWGRYEYLCHKKDGHPLVVCVVQDAVVWLFSRAVALLETWLKTHLIT